MTAGYTPHAVVIRADARALPLSDASVDLVCTSPPFWALRSYTDGGQHYAGQIGAEPTPGEYIDNLIACTREWMRVLKPSGSLWINLGDKYAQDTERSRNGHGGALVGTNPLRDGPAYSGRRTNGAPRKSLIGLPWRYALRCIDELGLILRAEVIWSKPNGLPESVTDRVRRSHETWFHLVRSPRYFSAVDGIREAYSENKPWGAAQRGPGKPSFATSVLRGTDPSQQQSGLSKNKERVENPLGKLPGSVWSIATEPLLVPDHLGVDHFAAFPIEWPRRIILGWSPNSGVVLDPFGGTGTTALTAKALSRIGFSVDMSADYCRLAQWRTTDPGELARAMRVEKPEPVAEAQMSLDLGVA